MSVLDTFFTLFKSAGVEDVEKDNKRAKESNDKLDKSLRDSQKTSDDLGRSFKGLGNELIRMATAGLTGAGLLAGFKKSIDYTINLDQASRSLRVNVSDLDAWGSAVQKNGGTVETFGASLKNLAMHLGTTGDVALKTLPQFADSFQKLGRYGSFKYGAMLGMDESLILTLQKGRREVEALIQQQKELGVVTQRDAEVARQFNWAWQNATRSLRVTVLETATEILPYLTKAFSGIAESGNYLQQHKEAIVGALTAIGTAALYAARGFFTLRKAKIGLAIGGAGIIYEDVQAYRHGKNSAIGDFRNWFYNATKKYDEDRIKQGLKPLRDRSNEIPSLPLSDEHVKKLKDMTKEPLMIRTEELEALLPKAKAALGITTAVSLPSSSTLGSRSVSSRNISINIGDINIQTQPSDVASLTKAIDDTLKEQLRQALYNFDDGVLA